METRKRVRGIAHDTDVAKITLAGIPDRPGIASSIFAPLARGGINVDVIIQASSIEGLAEISFTVSRGDFARALEISRAVGGDLGARVESASNLAKISIVGTGLQSTPGEAALMFQTMADRDVNIDMITTSDIRITCVIDAARVPETVQALHEAFELDS
jgi:aspartate kinase